MPELPEVETVRRGLAVALRGAAIKSVTLRRKNLRLPFPKNMEKTLAGRRFQQIERRAKYLLFHLDSDDVLLAHLGMSGRFVIPALLAGSGSFDKHDHVIFTLEDGRNLIYNDARRFGLMTLVKKDGISAHPLLCNLGPEPFSKEFSSSYLTENLTGRKAPIKTVIMDQKLVVGVGNIYASEALFLTGIDPRKPADSAISKVPALIAAIRSVLDDAIKSGGSSLRDFVQVSGETGYFQHAFKVYGRGGKPCVSCGSVIKTLRQAGRSTFYCPSCQQ